MVRKLAAEGANVIFTYVRSEQKAQALAQEIEKLGVKAKAGDFAKSAHQISFQTVHPAFTIRS
ncbi:hypothetical protein ACUN24_20725 [Pedobacter sp. WC2501]|uniref:hypothetical protein n=1 Tax=Pedobacter sp. WC2501 TaxID=3461400 RepID=UPI004045CD3A